MALTPPSLAQPQLCVAATSMLLMLLDMASAFIKLLEGPTLEHKAPLSKIMGFPRIPTPTRLFPYDLRTKLLAWGICHHQKWLVPYRLSGFCMFGTSTSKQKHVIYILGWLICYMIEKETTNNDPWAVVKTPSFVFPCKVFHSPLY